MADLTIQAWKFDPAFLWTTAEVLPFPQDWIQTDANAYISASGSLVSLAPWLVTVELTDNSGDGILRGDTGDSFSIDGNAYYIYEVYNGDFATIDGVEYRLVTFYGTDGSGNSLPISLPVVNDAPAPAFAGILSGTRWIGDPNSVTLPPSTVPCFAAGTRIVTDLGPLPVQVLTRGMRVLTQDNGFQPIRWIGSVRLDAGDLRARPHLRPVLLPAGCLGKDLPDRDMRLSPQHRVLLRSEIVRRMCGTDEVLVPARALIGTAGIRLADPCREVEYFHFLLPRHEIVFANGAGSESLYPGTGALATLPPTTREELVMALLPDVPGSPPDAARPLVTMRKARRLASRHQKNGRPLIAPHAPTVCPKLRPGQGPGHSRAGRQADATTATQRDCTPRANMIEFAGLSPHGAPCPEPDTIPSLTMPRG